MKKLVATAAALGLTAAFAAPALADGHAAKPNAEVVETNASGKATKVKIGDRVYDVCMNDTQDGCINPREAGLNFGNWPVGYWPGKPASEIDGPLPVKKPA